MLQPKKTKFRRQQKGSAKGNAWYIWYQIFTDKMDHWTSD